MIPENAGVGDGEGQDWPVMLYLFTYHLLFIYSLIIHDGSGSWLKAQGPWLRGQGKKNNWRVAAQAWVPSRQIVVLGPKPQALSS